MFCNAKMATALLDCLTHYCHIVENGNERFPFKASVAAEISVCRKPRFLGHSGLSARLIVQYWRSFEHHEAYTRAPARIHWPAWRVYPPRQGWSGRCRHLAGDLSD
jgi:hypothetical protein